MPRALIHFHVQSPFWSHTFISNHLHSQTPHKRTAKYTFNFISPLPSLCTVQKYLVALPFKICILSYPSDTVCWSHLTVFWLTCFFWCFNNCLPFFCLSCICILQAFLRNWHNHIRSKGKNCMCMHFILEFTRLSSYDNILLCEICAFWFVEQGEKHIQGFRDPTWWMANDRCNGSLHTDMEVGPLCYCSSLSQWFWLKP